MLDAPDEQDRGALAAELALGLLEGSERAQALRLCLSDPAFAQDVEAWNARLSPLLGVVPATLPSPRVWEIVAARIAPAAGRPVLARLKAWRAGAMVSGAVTAALAMVLLWLPINRHTPAPMAVSQLAAADGAQVLAITYDPQDGMLRIGSQVKPGGSKSPELWVIPQDGIPRSLGMVAHGGGPIIVVPAMRPFLAADATLAITMEDPATAPHTAPSALPVMTGKISMI